jgi:hypothetical protein
MTGLVFTGEESSGPLRGWIATGNGGSTEMDSVRVTVLTVVSFAVHWFWAFGDDGGELVPATGTAVGAGRFGIRCFG